MEIDLDKEVAFAINVTNDFKALMSQRAELEDFYNSLAEEFNLSGINRDAEYQSLAKELTDTDNILDEFLNDPENAKKKYTHILLVNTQIEMLIGMLKDYRDQINKSK